MHVDRPRDHTLCVALTVTNGTGRSNAHNWNKCYQPEPAEWTVLTMTGVENDKAA